MGAGICRDHVGHETTGVLASGIFTLFYSILFIYIESNLMIIIVEVLMRGVYSEGEKIERGDSNYAY